MSVEETLSFVSRIQKHLSKVFDLELPRGKKIKKNTETFAMRYFIAKEAVRNATSMLADEKRNCEEAGLFSLVEELSPGSSAVLFDGTTVVLSARKNQPATKQDIATLRLALRKRGVDPALIEASFQEATITMRPATIIEARLK